MPGYSGRSLADKLGVKPGLRLLTISAPREYASLLAPLPAGAKIGRVIGKSHPAVHLFVKTRADLDRHLRNLRARLEQNGFIWVSWPKKTSSVETNVTEDTIRELALPMGYVDIKVCAVTDVWSGLKLVIRKAERTAR